MIIHADAMPDGKVIVSIREDDTCITIDLTAAEAEAVAMILIAQANKAKAEPDVL